jgi:N-methylhydantoinase A
VRSVAIKRGVDTRDLSLFAFGAAGPMLLPALLDIVPLRRVVVPPHPGLFSALGLLSSDQVYSDQRSAYTFLGPDAAESIDELYRSMETELLARIGLSGDGAEIRRTFDGRLFGQSWETPSVPVPGGMITPERIGELIANFHTAYRQRNGNTFEAFPIQAVTFRIEVQVAAAKVEYPKLEPAPSPVPAPTASTTIRHLYGDDVEAGEYERDHLLAGHVITGPAVIREQTSTTFVPAGYRAEVGEFGEITIS